MATRLDSALYWRLPTPASLAVRVAAFPVGMRATAMSFTRHEVPGAWDAVREGLRHAGMAGPIDLSIHGGADIAQQVAPHFGQVFMTAAQLAEASRRTAILLRPTSTAGARKCEAYFADFLAALGHAEGETHLVVGLQDEQHTEDRAAADCRVVAFSGALPEDEMSAYVGLRMRGRNGPGSTRLLRALVCEFAGFDALLAEQLIALDDAALLGLPGSLSLLLDAEPTRWRHESWLAGTRAAPDGRQVRHPLCEWYLALHQGPQQQEALVAAKRRYWRACLQVLTPWLEERRQRVLDVLKRPLDALYASQRVTRQMGRIEVDVDREDIEYNNIVGLAYNNLLQVPGDEHSQQALTVCKVAKRVRDDLAHLRAPSPNSVYELVANMDALLGLH